MFLFSRLIYFLLCLVIFFACVEQEDQNYVKEIEEWRRVRLDSLKGKTGYLNLTGLYWLAEGKNSFGADSANIIIFPKQAMAEMGVFNKIGDSVYMTVNPQVSVIVNGLEVQDSILLYGGDSVQLLAKSNALGLYIIKRGEQLGVRLRDYEHPLLEELTGIEGFPILEKYRVKATWEEYNPPKPLLVPNQVGMMIDLMCYGAFHFELDGEKFVLEPAGESYHGEYLLMIYDQTSGHETYGSGRYVYVPVPDENGISYIDFNKVYNPPCAYTEFATCLFPHEANRLPIRLEAGEKFAGH